MPAGSSCCNEFCAGLEQGWLRAEDKDWSPGPASICDVWLPGGWEATAPGALQTSASASAASSSDTVIALSRCWRFLCRAALPPRAPDMLS